MTEPDSSRRPLKSRGTAWAAYLLTKLSETSLSPNQVSLLSIAFAAVGAGALLLAGSFGFSSVNILVYPVAIIGIQGRLLCNLLDGMLAVEKGKKSATGEVFNDLPDRIADVLILLAAGFSLSADRSLIFSGVTLGWLAALCALFTAYLRLLGASCGTEHFFQGPMAKPHRMAALTLACLISILEVWLQKNYHAVAVALWLIVLGAVYTCVRRYRRIIDALENSARG